MLELGISSRSSLLPNRGELVDAARLRMYFDCNPLSLMKTKQVCGFIRRWLPWTVVLLGAAPNLSLGQSGQPVITSIRLEGTNVVVLASVPPGFQRLTLEGRARFGSGAWAPVAVTQVNGAAASVTFRVPCDKQVELLRLRADTQQALPASFYGGC